MTAFKIINYRESHISKIVVSEYVVTNITNVILQKEQFMFTQRIEM